MASSNDRDDGGDSTGSRLIDEQGRLLGLVNIVDAVVVLLVLAVVVAGVALLLPGGGGEPDSRFVTVDLGTQPEFVAEQISSGDTWEPDRTSDELVITDTYRTTAGDGTQVVIRAQVNGSTVEPDGPDEQPVFEFLGDSLRTNETYTIVTSEYQTNGTVTRVEQNGTQLQTAETPFVVETTVSEAVGDAIEVGDTFRRAGETLATIETIERLPGGDNQRLLLGMQGQTIERAGTQLFAGTQLRVGASVGFVGEGYEFTGEVRQPGTTDVEPVSQSVVVETSISADIAETLTTGDTFTVGDSTAATIDSVALYPAGETQRTALLGLEIATVGDGTERFAGRPVRVGNAIPFRTDEYELSATIRERGTTAIDTVERPFVIETTVSEDVGDAIEVGDTFQQAGETLATIETIERLPGGDNQRLLLGIQGQTIERAGTQLFAGTQLQVGASVGFVGENYEFTGEVRQTGTTDVEPVSRSVVVETSISADTAETLTTGDTFTVGDSTAATIDSVALYPAGETQRTALLGLEIATVGDGTERFAGRPIRVGNTIPFRTDEYELSATIRERGTTAIDTVERPFVIETTVPDVVAADIAAGDTFTLAGRDIVSVGSVTSYTTDVAGQRRVILGVNVAVREDGDELRFGEQRLRVGQSIPVRTGEYDITGEIIDRGTLEEPGEQTTQSIVFGVDNVRPERAASLTVGLREQTRDLTTAIVRDKIDEPAVIALTSEDGNIFERQHPVNRDVELEVELTARELPDGNLRFRGEPLRSGEQLTLELGFVRVTGTVFEISDG